MAEENRRRSYVDDDGGEVGPVTMSPAVIEALQGWATGAHLEKAPLGVAPEPAVVPAQRKILRAEELASQARLLRLEAIEEARGEGRSYGEIGSWIGISRQSIQVWFNRARGADGSELRRHHHKAAG
jgi:hypothetical protein